MKLFVHFSPAALSNTYLLGPDGGGDAVLVDPSVMNADLLDLVESNGYYVRTILITRLHPASASAIETLLKIYDAGLYGSVDSVANSPCTRVSDGDRLAFGDIEVSVIDLGHFPGGTILYQRGNMLFSGDLLGAGTAFRAVRRPLQYRLALILEERVLSLPEDTLLFPGSGPPSTIRAERAFNPLM